MRLQHPQNDLLKLPCEILRRTIRMLGKRHAANIAQTCSHLRPFGEEVVWREIHISDKAHGSAITAQPSKRMSAIAATISTSSDTPRDPVTALLYLIQPSPARRKSIKHLFLHFRADTPAHVTEVLMLLGPTLQTLEWRTDGPAFYISKSLLAAPRLFEAMPGGLSNLCRLSITIRADWVRTMLAIAAAARYLETLEVSSHPRLIPCGPDITRRPQDLTRATMPRLRCLTVGNMQASFAPLLEQLIRSSPHIEHIALDDHCFAWRIAEGDNVLDAIVAAPNLKSLRCSSLILTEIREACGDGVLAGLEFLSVIWDIGTAQSDPESVSDKFGRSDVSV